MRIFCIMNEAGLQTRLMFASPNDQPCVRRSTVSTHDMQFRTIEFKIYPSLFQQDELNRHLRICCRTYNQALEKRIAAYRETGKSPSYHDQTIILTQERMRDAELASVPVEFTRDALRRVDRGMKAFFRRCKSGDKPGFPRFRPQQRYNSLEQIDPSNYFNCNRIRLPKIGYVRARGPFGRVSDTQKLLRIIRRASGWYAQVLCEFVPEYLPEVGRECGIDLGLTSFLTLDTGETIDNPRTLRKASKRLRAVQKQLSRCQDGSRRRAKQKRVVARVYERVVRKRRGFCHRVSRDIANRFDKIAYEDLNVKGLSSGMLAKSVNDAAWSTFIVLLTVKAENAGRQLVKVDPRGTSQECPDCGAVVRKELSERVHNCPCGLRLDRDHAAAIVIKNRAFRRDRGGPVSPLADAVAGSMKRKGAL